MPYEPDPPEAGPNEATGARVRQINVDPGYAGQRLDNFLRRELNDVPKSHVYRVIRTGEVRVNGKRAKPETRLTENDVVRVPPLRAAAPRLPGGVPPDLVRRVSAAIVAEEREMLVIDKPAGIAVHGGSGVTFGIIEALRATRPDETLELAHRLDRDTSGLLLVARRPAALRILHALLRDGAFNKRYLALVRGKWELGEKRIDAPLRTDTRVHGERTVQVHASGKEARSDFRPVQFFGKRATLVEVNLLTGRTHQIRVHAAHAGYPVAGDEKYGDPDFNVEMRELGLQRMFLHAHALEFAWPDSGNEVSLSAPLPAELAAVIDRLTDLAGVKRRRPTSNAKRPAAKRRKNARVVTR
ncbi:MAG TPA: RluA family pseudouridine synthase [Steroidobacteraceae bacterium]|nr:RluA family pseudouridine synthase [Steroidobacteraceae bacterium]